MKILNKHIAAPQTFQQRLFTLTASAILAVLVSTGLSYSNNTQAETQMLDQVIAIVDDDVVLASELQERMRQVVLNIEKSGKTAPPLAEIQQEILNQLILENIQLQMANRAGVRISDAELNESLARIAGQNRMTIAQFKAALENDGLSYTATREQIRKDMMLQRVQQGNVNRSVQITDQEINNFLASEEGKTLTAPEYRMLHTLLPVASGADQATIDAAQQRADTLYQQIQSSSYEQVLTAAKLEINDLSWRKAADLPSLISDLATTLDKTETAKPVQSPSGFHLVKLLDKRGDGEVIPQTKARHILLKSSAIRDENATKAEINNLRKKIINGADFAELARKFSEDIGSAQEGGDLGWTSPGQLVGAFQTAMDDTDIDKVSPAFRSEYGWHILQVLERREKDVTDDIRKNMARGYIHRRKYDDELQTWLQKIRDEAYVDFK
ncbi:peptidylprolyl isomerase [Oceanicoccus sp. KOV_DT_Chl]|uniref:peptidylprolyl isomerase n=1 Tax=Oceanicoccus sp. KOV_DT_Chl TaxID=1904639 RepID=UPI000C7CDCAE